MTSPLDAVKRHAAGISRETRARDVAIIAARQTGETWLTIAIAADLTERGAQKIAARHARRMGTPMDTPKA